MRYAAVFVDAGRVLLHPDDTLFQHEALALGCPLADQAATIALGRTVWEGAATNDPVAFWNSPTKIEAWSRHAGLPSRTGHVIWNRVHDRDRAQTPLWSRPDPGAADALHRLSIAGYRIAVVSNNDGRLHRQLTAAGLIGCIDAIIDSAVVRMAKPSPEIFVLAAAELRVPIGECLMIGDDPYFDIQASLQAGAGAALLIDPAGDRPATWSTPAYRDLNAATSALLRGEP